eukprot:IDg12389t1
MSSAMARFATRATAAGTRGLHTTAPRKAGGYDYLHDQYMYKFRFKAASKPKAFGLIFGGVALAVYIPIFSVNFNQRKAGLK